MTTLYICVDESGNRQRHDHYVVAASWFVSDRENPSNVLDGTKDRILAQCVTPSRKRSGATELKGASLHPSTVDDTVDFLRTSVHEEISIRPSRLPWELSTPVVFSISAFATDVFLAATDDAVGRSSAFQRIQVASLSAVLAPVHRPRRLLDEDSFDDVRILLDATTWQNAAETIRRQPSLDDVTIEIGDSKSTPGIQFADLAAYAWFQRLQRGNCRRAAELIHQLRLVR